MKSAAKIISALLAVLLVFSFSGCGNSDEKIEKSEKKSSGSSSKLTYLKTNKLPEDWVIMPYSEAETLYHDVEFTLDNINDYIILYEDEDKVYNGWDELQEITCHNILEFSANVSHHLVFESDFLADITYTVEKYTVKLNPETLEEIEIIGEPSQHVKQVSVSPSSLGYSLVCETSYSIYFNADGTAKTDENGELIVSKRKIVDFKVDRVKGYAKWIDNIDEKYVMSASEHTHPEVSLYLEDDTFIIIEGKKYFYCYDSTGQTIGINEKGEPELVFGSICDFTEE